MPIIEENQPVANKIKQGVLAEALKRWTEYAKNPRAGRKDMTAGPLEKAVRSAIRQQLKPLHAEVTEHGKKFDIYEGMSIIADCVVSKGERRSLISIKTWITQEAVRETFAYAYFAKTWHGRKYLTAFMVTLPPISVLSNSDNLIAACAPYVDGIYSLSGQPYIDELIEKLRQIYVQD